jgi:hypothetical protein
MVMIVATMVIIVAVGLNDERSREDLLLKPSKMAFRHGSLPAATTMLVSLHFSETPVSPSKQAGS